MAGCNKNNSLENGRVITSEILSCTESNCTTDGATVTNLKSIDDASAKTILDALCALSESDLQKLADIIESLLSGPSVTSAPASTSDDYTPDEIYGNRSALLGEPDQWLDINGLKVPSYE